MGSGEDVVKLDAQVGVEAVARDEHQRRDEPLVGIATHKQRDAMALLKAQDAETGVEQLVLGGLEQLVARVGLEDVLQRLAVAAVPREAADIDDAADFLRQ